MARRGGIALTAAVMLVAPGLPALGAGKFAPPEGCEVFATVQLRNCQISHHYRCAGDAPGDQWSVHLDGSGPFYVSKIDAETRWIESHDLYTGEVDRLKDETDPASLTVLLQSGRDDYDFTTESSTGEIRRYTGFDELTGDTATIDGMTLERTKFDLTARAEDGTVLWRRSGQQFVHRDWRLFLADRETFENGAGDTATVTDTPMEFALPGEKGFLSADPQYDCDALMTEAVEPGGIIHARY